MSYINLVNIERKGKKYEFVLSLYSPSPPFHPHYIYTSISIGPDQWTPTVAEGYDARQGLWYNSLLVYILYAIAIG